MYLQPQIITNINDSFHFVKKGKTHIFGTCRCKAKVICSTSVERERIKRYTLPGAENSGELKYLKNFL